MMGTIITPAITITGIITITIISIGIRHHHDISTNTTSVSGVERDTTNENITGIEDIEGVADAEVNVQTLRYYALVRKDI